MKMYLVLFFLLFSAAVSAQVYGNGTGYGYGNRGGGVDRSLTGQRATKKVKQDAEPVDVIEVYVKKLDDKLKFDSFQMAVVQQLLKENKIEEDRIMASSEPVESKYELIVGQREKLNKKVMEILTPDQVVIFEKLAAKKKL